MGEKPTWGEPSVMFYGLSGSVGVDETPIKLDGVTNLSYGIDCGDVDGDVMNFQPSDFSLSFDLKMNKATFRSVRKLFRYRMPRKTKKRFKKQFAKTFGVKVKKLRFNYRLFNKQKHERHDR